MFPFAQSVSSKYPVLSVYLNKGPALGAQLTDVLKPLKENDLDHAQQMSLRADFEKISNLRLDQETAPAIGIFACDGEGWFHVERLRRSVSDYAAFGSRAYLRPLRTLPRTTRTAVTVIESRTATLWNVEAGLINKVHDIAVDETVKKNYGGWHGYAEGKARGHSDELVRRHYQETAETLFAMHKAEPFDYLAVGGHQSDTHDFVSTLHPYLAHLVVGEFVIDPHTMTKSMVLDFVSEMEAAAERKRRVSLVGQVVEARSSNRKGALGLSEVVAAANVSAVHSLFVRIGAHIFGFVCDDCGWMSVTGGECQACGAEPRRVNDLVDDVIAAVIRDGGTVEGIGPDTVLDEEVVGGLLRFAV